MADAAAVWHGPEELRPLLLPLAAVRRHRRNPRRGDVALVADSLARYGQTRPIVAHVYDGEETPTIVAGNHTYQGAERNGWTHIAVLIDPGMSDDEGDDFLLMDNAASDRAVYDDDALIGGLQRLYDQGRLAGTGYTPDDLDDLIAGANKIAETARQEFLGGYAETPEEEAARAQRAGNQHAVKQLPLSYRGEEFRDLTLKLGVLAKEYETSGVVATVTEATDRVFASLWSE